MQDDIAEALKAMGIRSTADILAERAKGKKKARKPFPIILPEATDHGQGRWEIMLWDWLPTSLSTLMHINHWRAGKIKHDEAMLIAASLLAAGCTGALGRRKLTMTMIITSRMRERDQDNVWKGTKDALVRCKACVDDKPKWLDHDKPLYERGPRKGTRLLLEDI